MSIEYKVYILRTQIAAAAERPRFSGRRPGASLAADALRYGGDCGAGDGPSIAFVRRRSLPAFQNRPFQPAYNRFQCPG
jgi:hypothetical protein